MLAADEHTLCRREPFVALAAAAAVTTRIRLGSYVCNAGVRGPMLLAADVATLDLVSDGRARLGLGAGHTPAEWDALGRVRPDTRGRVERCIAVAEATQRLLAGERVSVDTPLLTMKDAVLQSPRPVQDRIPLTVGTANSRLLRWAGEHADIVSLTGFGRTLRDGHSHDARWRLDEIDAQVGLARTGGPAVLEALVQFVEVTPDAEAVLAAKAEESGVRLSDLREVPFMLVGTPDDYPATIRVHLTFGGGPEYAVMAQKPLTWFDHELR